MAAFYRLVGGDYDVLFLETQHPSLSFIYQSLGCYHTLQPQADPYTAPTVPALTPQGFVRWQTVQLLLEPEEHVPLLQTAVKRFDISNPTDGTTFPGWLPREALPSKPDREMIQWHETVSQRLSLEARATQIRSIPSSHQRKLSDGLSDGTLESSRDSSVTDDRSLVDATTYFSEPRPRPQFRAPEPLRMQQTLKSARKEPLPWSPERQRSSSDSNLQRSATWSTRDQLGRHNTITRHGQSSRSRPRSASTTSTSSSSSSSSSITTSSGESLNPRHHHSASTATLQPRRPSNHQLSDPRNGHGTSRQDPSRPVPPSQNPLSSFSHPYPSAPAPVNGNARGHNVRWGNDSVYNISSEGSGDRKSRAKSEERPRRRDEDSRGSRDKRRLKGVEGRRYGTEGWEWR